MTTPNTPSTPSTPSTPPSTTPSTPADTPRPLMPNPPLSAAIAPLRPSPNWRFMLAHPAHAVALGFGSGLAPFAPGTVGTLWGWAAFLVLQPMLSAAQMGMLVATACLVGWWACQRTALDLGVMDPGCIVWDEIVAIWLVLWLAMPMGFWGQLVAFGLFRYFDAAKPGPVGWADKAFKGFGWRGAFGIIFDDLVAAFCTLLVIAVGRWWE